MKRLLPLLVAVCVLTVEGAAASAVTGGAAAAAMWAMAGAMADMTGTNMGTNIETNIETIRDTTVAAEDVIRIAPGALVNEGAGAGVALEPVEARVGTRTFRTEVVRLDPGTRLAVPIDAHGSLGARPYLAFGRYIPDHLQATPAKFALLYREAVIYEAHGILEVGGGPFETIVLPLPGDVGAEGSTFDPNASLEVLNTDDQPLYVWELLLFDDMSTRTAMDVYFLVGDIRNPDQLERSIALIPTERVPGEGSSVGVAVNWPFLGSLSDRSRQSNEVDFLTGFRRAQNLGETHGLKVNVKLTSDWGGWPIWISDGEGGRFGDLEYQQIVYSPHHVRETPVLRELLGEAYAREYGLTTPNRWSNTPWLTYNHPRLNAFLVRQYAGVASVYDRILEERILAGEPIPFAPLSTGTESLYWVREGNRGMDDFVYAEYNDGINRDPLTGDFNPHTVEAARRDGVELDPADGLDERERAWLHDNLARYTQMLVDAMYGAQGGPILQVSEDGELRPVAAPRHETYTEPYGYRFYPYWDPARSMMQIGVVRGARPGAQWYTTDFVPYLRRQREFGSTANPNFEWTGIAGEDDAVASLRAAYAFGIEFVTLYNWTNDVERAKRVFERYGRDFPVAFSYGGRLASAGEGAYRQVFRPRGELHVINVLDVEAGALPAGAVAVTLKRRVFLSEEPVVSFVVPVAHAELLEDGYVRLALPEIWLPTDSNYVVELRSNGWSLPPNPGLRIGLDLVRARGHSQLIQARGEALRLLDVIEPGEGDGISWQGKGPSEWISEAKRRLAAGRFEEAVDALLIADGLRLPARFVVEAGQGFVFPWGATLTPNARTLLTIGGILTREGRVEVSLDVRQAGVDEPEYALAFPGGAVRVEETPGSESGAASRATVRVIFELEAAE